MAKTCGSDRVQTSNMSKQNYSETMTKKKCDFSTFSLKHEESHVPYFKLHDVREFVEV